MMWPYGYGPGWGWGAMLMGWLWMLVIVAAIVAVVVLFVRSGTGRQPETPLEILRKRYAAGELTKEQFDQMKRDVA